MTTKPQERKPQPAAGRVKRSPPAGSCSAHIDTGGTFAQRAQAHFAAAGIESWYHLAQHANLDTQTLYRYRNGRTPPVDIAIRIAKTLHTTVENLWKPLP